MPLTHIPSLTRDKRPRDGGDRRGFALVVVILGLVLVGTLLASGYLAAVQEFRGARSSVVQQRALTAAEFGLDTAYSAWKKTWNGMRVGQTVTLAYTLSDGSVDTVRVTKLTQFAFQIVSDGRAAGSLVASGARRRSAMLVRLDGAFNQPAAIVTRGNVSIGGNSAFKGTDTTFSGWNCPPAGAPVAGVMVPSISNLKYGGSCQNMSCISGSPLVSVSAQASDTNTYFTNGTQTWNSMVAQADVVVGSGGMPQIQPSYNADGSCKTTDPSNWGDPNRAATPGACESYFPIIYASGDLSVNGKVGQGILLVGGNLYVQGNFSFYGQVITRGTVKLTGSGNHISGGVLAADVLDSTATASGLGASAIQYSRCTLNAVHAASAPPVRAKQRSWTDMF